MYDETKQFLTELLESIPPVHDRLIEMLEALKLVGENTPQTDPSDWDGELPKDDFLTLYTKLGAKFPEYGYYPDTAPGDPNADKSSLGDAIDDLCDIARDLAEAIWLYENVSEAEAKWHFKFSYEIHWGEHLAKLLLYLKASAPRLHI